MKCPKCGFVSYRGLTQCKKCGYKFPQTRDEVSPSLDSSFLPDPPPPSKTPEAPLPPPAALGKPEDDILESPTKAEPAPPAAEPDLPISRSPVPEGAHGWRDELAERVESFRRRRQRLHRGLDSGSILNLQFPEDEAPEEPLEAEAKILEFPQPEPLPASVGLADRASPNAEGVSLEELEGETGMLSSAAAQAGEVTFEPPVARTEGEEIVVEAPKFTTDLGTAEADYLFLEVAPVGRRFLAGVADALVLMLGATLFSLIFWRAGGHLTPRALNLGVLGFIAAFFILAYHGLLVALTSSTPGLLWMGLELRNLDGERPTPREAFWRAFGFLISVSALMLGVIWALVDSESLTWHDRMSGTFPTSASREGRAA